MVTGERGVAASRRPRERSGTEAFALAAALLCATACAAPSRAGPADAGPDEARGEPAAARTAQPRGVRTEQEGTALPPPGHGTLRQDQFTIELRSDVLRIKLTPLSESVIRLAAPDTYTRLHALAESRRPDVSRRTRADAPTMFLVSVFSNDPDVTYQPEDIQVTHRGRLLRPAAILPLTPGWGRQRLQQQRSESAIYAFDHPIDLQQPLTVQYRFARSDAWSHTIVPRLDEERAKVRARAGGSEDPPGSVR